MRIKACLGGGYKFIGVAHVQMAAWAGHSSRVQATATAPATSGPLLQKCGRVTLELLSLANLCLNAAAKKKKRKTNY